MNEEHSRKLRQEAERRLDPVSESADELAGMSAQDIAGLIHELRVHQIELKMQNDELRRIQIELEKARNRYVHLYDFAPTAYFTVNEKGVVAEINLTAATLLGRQRAALVGQMFSRFIHREDQDVWYLHRKRLFESGDFQTFQLRLLKSDGEALHANLECTLIRDADSGLKEIRIAAADITGLKKAEADLHQANITLEQRVADRTGEVGQRNLQLQRLALEMSDVEDRERRRIAMVLHDDLQQRLVSLRFKVWDIVPRDQANEHVEERVKELEEEIAESIKITRSLSVDLSPPILRQHGLMAALRWLATEMQSKHGLSVSLHTEKEAEPESAALSSVLFRTVNELLFNVVKHAGARAAQVDVRLEGGAIIISVSDEGKGFDAAAFHTGQSTNQGFGLFSIEERFYALGGKVSIDAAPGKGCRVTVSVPRGEPARDQQIDTPVAKPVSFVPKNHIAASGKRRIRTIVADDHPLMREGMANLLKSRDSFEVVAQAEDGRQVVQMASELNPDLILMDVSMPELDGIKATSQIARSQPRVCIVGLSMHDDLTTRERMLSAGAADHLCKSYQAQELIESIYRIANRWEKKSDLV